MAAVRAGFDEPVARADAGGAHWYLADRLGSVVAVTDATGAMTGTQAFGANGVLVSSAGTGLDQYAFTGREYDAVLRLQYSRCTRLA